MKTFNLIFCTLFILLLAPGESYASQAYSGNFNAAVEDVPADQGSDVDANDILQNIDFKIHVDSLGRVLKVTTTVVPIAFGAMHDLKMHIGANVAQGSLLIHGESSVGEFSLPHTLYTAGPTTNELFSGCADVKMVNVFEDSPSCTGTEKTFSIFFIGANKPVFSSYGSAEEFVISLFTIENLTLNETISSGTANWGFQNMIIIKIFRHRQKFF